MSAKEEIFTLKNRFWNTFQNILSDPLFFFYYIIIIVSITRCEVYLKILSLFQG